MQSIFVSLDIAKFVDLQWKKCWCQQNSNVCVTWFIYFFDLLRVRYNCAKFHYCRICVKDFREGDFFAPHLPPICEEPLFGPSWIELIIHELSSYYSNINLTYEVELHNKLEFLDLCMTRINKSKIETPVYRKATNTNFSYKMVFSCFIELENSVLRNFIKIKKLISTTKQTP